MSDKPAKDHWIYPLLTLALFGYGAYVVIWDLSHPEIWDNNPLHDPRLYWPTIPLVALLVICSVAYIVWQDYQDELWRQKRRDNMAGATVSRPRKHAADGGSEVPEDG